MKIMLLVSRAGPAEANNRGDVIDVDQDEAIRMIEAGQAEAVREAPAETATPKGKAEKAVK